MANLNTLQEIYLKVTEAIPDAIIVCDPSGEVVVFNAQAELLFGYERHEVLGRPIEMLLPEALRRAHARHRQGYLMQPTVREMGVGLVLEALNRSGETFPVQIKLSPMVVSGAGLHVLAVARRVIDQPLRRPSIMSTVTKDDPDPPEEAPPTDGKGPLILEGSVRLEEKG